MTTENTLYVYTESKTYTIECGLDLAQWVDFILQVYNECGYVESYEYCMETGYWILGSDINEKVRYNIDLYPEFAEIFGIKYC